MFTGLIQDVGTVVSVVPSGQQARLVVETGLSPIEIGESIAVDGACLSATSFEPGPARFTAFTSAETLSRTGLGQLNAGARVNLERAVGAGEPLGGHLVTGHVDDRVALIERAREGEAERWIVALPADDALRHQIAAKGSVALNGVSLTVNEVRASDFSLMLIPLTLKETTLGDLGPGALINLETDVLAKYVARQLERGTAGGAGVDMELLVKSGFVR
jgi:riboflavin synthase